MSESVIRQDFYTYNESTGFFITSVSQAGKWADKIEQTEEACEGVRSGAFLALELVQDDSIVSRVIVGGELSEEEQNSWVYKHTGKLKVPDGKLLLCGGVFDLTGDSEPGEEYSTICKIEPGEYRINIYTLLPSINSYYDMPRSVQLGKHWRETRPDQPLPDWLVELCADEPDHDPGYQHKSTYEEPEDNAPMRIDFILHLTQASEPFEITEFAEGEYFFPINTEFRLPPRCPIGIKTAGKI